MREEGAGGPGGQIEAGSGLGMEEAEEQLKAPQLKRKKKGKKRRIFPG